MQIELDRPSQFRVLMRIPKLRQHLPAPASQAAPAADSASELPPPKPEFEVSEVTQQVADDIATARQGHRLLRPVLLVQVLAIVIALILALVYRGGGMKAPPTEPGSSLETPAVTMPDPAATAVPGGSPTQITSIPELALPAANPTASVDWAITRLPPVSPVEAVDFAQSPSSASLPAAIPGMARLNPRIETPKPEANHDSTRSGVY